MTNSSRFKQYIFLLMSFFVCLLIVVLVGEFAARAFGFDGVVARDGIMYSGRPEGNPFNTNLNDDFFIKELQNPESLKSKLSPLSSQVTQRDWIKFKTKIIDLRKPKEKKRILFIGDSGTYGSGLKWDEAFPELIQESLGNNFEVLNAGVPGSGPIESFDLLRRYLLKVEPDNVVFTFFLANDISQHYLRDLIKSWKRNFWYGPEVRFLQKSALFNLIRFSIALFKLKMNNVKFNIEEGFSSTVKVNPTSEDFDNILYSSNDGFLNETYDSLRHEIEKLKLELDRLNIRFAILLYPSPLTVSSDAKLTIDNFNREQPVQRIQKICQETQVKCINPISKIREELGDKFFIPLDYHASKEGNLILRDSLLEHI